jgi:hypothetical protein
VPMGAREGPRGGLGGFGRRREQAEVRGHRGSGGNGGWRSADSRAGGEGGGFL